VKALARGFVEAVFPPVCAACDRAGREPFCRLCSEALLDADPFALEGIARAAARYTYGGPAALALQRLKYDRRADLGRALGTSLAPAIAAVAPFDLIVPIPLAPERLHARGFNQALELARSAGGPIAPRVLRRRPGDRPQVGLPQKERITNVAGAFSVADPARVRGVRVLLADDVVTTGATARAAARVLVDAGAREVALVAFARAELGTPGA
jgi:ComF family protein